MFSGTPSATMQETLQWIFNREGYEGLRAYLRQMPNQQLEALLVESEMRDLFSGALPPPPVPSRTSSLFAPPAMRPLAMAAGVGSLPSMPSVTPPARDESMGSLGSLCAFNQVAESRHHLLMEPSLLSPAPLPANIPSAARLGPLAEKRPRHVSGGARSPGRSLSIPSDAAFLDPVHNLLRQECIEVFVATESDLTAPGKKARPKKAGQVGLRCVHCKDACPRGDALGGVDGSGGARLAVCFPSRRDTIFESVRNYQRTHLDACPHVPQATKALHRALLLRSDARKKPQKVLRAYYAEAAAELGIVDTPIGLALGAPPNDTGVPSAKLQAIVLAAASPSGLASLCRAAPSPTRGGGDGRMEMRKFAHVASAATQEALATARREPTAFVKPQDYATASDVDFLLFHQLRPFRPSAARLERRGLCATASDDEGGPRTIPGLCCRHCAGDGDSDSAVGHRGAYLPTDLASLVDSSFTQTLWNHIMTCPAVPREVKDALDELKRLASEYGIATKRGSKKNFFRKIWGRMEKHYEGRPVPAIRETRTK